MTDRLDEIKARLEAATPGPWEWHTDYGDVWSLRAQTGDIIRALEGAVYDEYDSDPATLDVDEKNMELIAHAPEDIKWLIALAEKQTAEVERLRATINKDNK